ncbi:pilus assembly protein [Flavobacterium sp. MXW15]|uniref:Pilus assembly protein n=1 Tax=Xanthomonas chitinilytica TaxID=2989819 RepID=A0ABT3JXZ8_9XANT|nr:TadE/TadG family type IV pilus assembly protein [Xanthomonas sp. H13-6]MCW4454364.1 pilus assembly protein [Flavobacterium sp. MXW15]MCW4473326.1 pilus assembly protein [Xanthomonas sp. H13-6]
MKRSFLPRRYQRGQSLVEFCIVVPAFLFLILVTLQFILIYRAKSTLDYATFQAARKGALAGADKGKMKTALANGMVPLFATSPDAGGVATALVKAQADVRLFANLDVISPTPQAWTEHRERQHDGRYALPNDSLAFRRNTVGSSNLSVQDANILKIKVTYHYPLIVPFADRVIVGLSKLVTGGESYAPPSMLVEEPVSGHRRLPIESYAVVRMQSPIHDQANLR